MLRRRHRDVEAAAAFRESLRLRPDAARAHHHLAVTLERLGRYDDAAAAFREARSACARATCTRTSVWPRPFDVRVGRPRRRGHTPTPCRTVPTTPTSVAGAVRARRSRRLRRGRRVDSGAHTLPAPTDADLPLPGLGVALGRQGRRRGSQGRATAPPSRIQAEAGRVGARTWRWALRHQGQRLEERRVRRTARRFTLRRPRDAPSQPQCHAVLARAIRRAGPRFACRSAGTPFAADLRERVA